MNSLKEYLFEHEFIVRDYELDIQGIVNNANYMHYLEHARHEFLISKNVDFSVMHEEGKDLIVTSAELSYKLALKSRDRFVVRINILRKGNLRLIFEQDIYRLPDNKLILEAKITGACIYKDKPVVPSELFKSLGL
jgi:acyl-CoA thioester hydrolase